MPLERIRIAIVDDHTLFRSGLASLLKEFEEIEIVFEATNGNDLQKKIPGSEPEVILMDINMPMMDGYETTRWLKENYPQVKVMALSMFEEDKAIINMLKSGAVGYMLKESRPMELKEAIKTIVKKGFYINELVSGKLLSNMSQSNNRPNISEKESTFLQFCSTEMTYKEIADQMSVSPRTVDNYRESLFAKLSIKSRTGLVVYGIKNGLITI